MKSLSSSPIHNNGLPEVLLLWIGLLELTTREWQVLIRIADDLTKSQIANQLCMTEKSVQNYRNRISNKLDLKGRDNLARFARKHATDLRRWDEPLVNKCPNPMNLVIYQSCSKPALPKDSIKR